MSIYDQNGAAYAQNGSSGGPLPAPGTAGQVLTLDSGLAAEWADAAGGGRTRTAMTFAAPPWTITNSAGAMAGGVYTVTIPSGAPSTSGANGTLAWSSGADYELCARVAFTGSTASSLIARLFQFYATDWVLARISPDGTCELIVKSAGFASYALGTLTTAVWVRFGVIRGVAYLYVCASDSATLPTSGWRYVGSTTCGYALGSTGPTETLVQGTYESGSPAGTDQTVAWSALTRCDPTT